MKHFETVLFVMDSIRKTTSRHSNERQFDKGKLGARFHVRQVLHFKMTIEKSSGFIWLIVSDQVGMLIKV